ncbi:MAG: hypothetical protein AB8B53_02670 [Flavobacteriales bacterium]
MFHKILEGGTVHLGWNGLCNAENQEKSEKCSHSNQLLLSIVNFKYQAIIFVFFLTGFASVSGTCQTQADEKLLTRLESTLLLDSAQVTNLNSVFKSYALQLDSINATIKTVQTSSLEESEISKKSAVLFRERKDLNTWKNTQLRSELTPEQQKKYDTEIVAKSRPVLHFGHDKAKCKACKPGDPGYVPGQNN